MRAVSQLKSEETAESVQSAPDRRVPLPVIVPLLLILAATIFAYSPVLFNFFLGDDFVHLTWLPQAIHNPELILRNFHSSWLDGTTTRFYRPLISVFMVSDYLVWGVNGLGFHLTNLFFHLAGTFFLFLTVRQLSQTPQASGCRIPSGTAWALGTAAIFALYPLHPEAVSWITGRVDSVVTAFCLATCWGYIRWRNGGGLPALAFTLASMVLALLSKEMAITLPAVCLAWEVFLWLPSAWAGSSDKKRLLSGSLLAISPLWILLGAYFCLRYFALGTFIGGYDDSLLFIANIKSFILNWLHGLRMMVVPINKTLLGSHSPLTRSWEILTVAAALGGMWALARGKFTRQPFLFVLFWLALSLVPVYKIFAIGDDLQGSRLAYLATAPLSALIAYGFFAALNSGNRRLNIARAAAGLIFICLSTLLLWTNNQTWRAAGQEANAIRNALSRLYALLPGDPQVLFIGLPDHRNGAYLCRNALWGMTKRPQLARDINNCLMVNPFEPILPFGFLKDSIRLNQKDILIYRWDAAAREFAPIPLPEPGRQSVLPEWAGQDLKKALSWQPSASVDYRFQESGALALKSSDTGKRPEILLSTAGLPCFDLNFIEVTLRLNSCPERGLAAGADLLYANDVSPDFDLPRRTHAPLESGKKEQKLVFALHGMPEWSLGGRPRGLKLLLPPGANLEIKSLKFLPPEKVMPLLNFDNAGYLGSKGYLHLSPAANRQMLSVTAAGVPGATATEIEITRANLLFEEQNCLKPSNMAMTTIAGPLTGTVSLSRQQFKAKGIYELRVWAKDGAGARTGVASDHIVVAVDE